MSIWASNTSNLHDFDQWSQIVACRLPAAASLLFVRDDDGGVVDTRFVGF
ncbi:hypothetical protein RSAG8_02237, partial [Rhizoctonia solani AG-8 WAC10335]